MEAQKKLGNLTNEQAKIKNNVLENLNIDLDKTVKTICDFIDKNSN